MADRFAGDALPIDAALPALTAALRGRDCAVLVAPPGAGKTTRVPLVLMDEPWAQGRKILVLEPRRIAARAAAARMAVTLGEPLGGTVGLRVRFGSKVSAKTRIEVVTEGVFTRLVLDDPALTGIAAVLFDEFHERSLDADLGLALARDVQQGLREDLKLLVMSATLDGARVSRLLGDAPVVESAGRAFPVETRYFGRDASQPVERQVAAAVQRALRAEPGSVLAFLPGAGEIRRAETLLREAIDDPAVDVVALYGALDADVQDRAIAPAPSGRRKVVLATSIAETSLTIEGVRIVVDGGLARVPRYEPDVGVTRLETVRVSRAAADQRRGRAGRTEPGVCYRLWDEAQTSSLEASSRPEILAADLSGMVLDLAHWGVSDSATLAFLDPPPKAAWSEAVALLRGLGALDGDGRITDHGKRLRDLPLPPRLARMVTEAADPALAARIALVVTERGLGGTDPDLGHRLDALSRDRSGRAREALAMARRWADTAREGRDGEAPEAASVGATLALAYPDRVARSRGGGEGLFQLANGRGAKLDPASALAREPFIVVADMTGTAAQGRIQLAAAIAPEEIERLFAGQIESRDTMTFEPASRSLRARRQRRLGALTLAEQILRVAPDAETASVLAAGLLSQGIDRLPWSDASRQLRDRIMFLCKAEGEDWPDFSDSGLAASADDWLTPVLTDKTSAADLGADELSQALLGVLPWPLRQRLDAEAPTHFEAPTGSRIPIDYAAEGGPKAALRLQELFGLSRHPVIAGGRVPLLLELLSPAHRPVQLTRDLPGFWAGSYAAVRADLRGRYPRHPWPEDPAVAEATRRAKPRGT